MQIECGIQITTDNLLHIMLSDCRAEPKLQREHAKQPTHTTSIMTMMRFRAWTQKYANISSILRRNKFFGSGLEDSSSRRR